MSSVKRIGKGISLLDLPDNYIVVDLETTGLDPVGCEIIEIGAIRCIGGEELDRFESLIKPSGPLPGVSQLCRKLYPCRSQCEFRCEFPL